MKIYNDKIALKTLNKDFLSLPTDENNTAKYSTYSSSCLDSCNPSITKEEVYQDARKDQDQIKLPSECAEEKLENFLKTLLRVVHTVNNPSTEDQFYGVVKELRIDLPCYIYKCKEEDDVWITPRDQIEVKEHPPRGTSGRISIHIAGYINETS